MTALRLPPPSSTPPPSPPPASGRRPAPIVPDEDVRALLDMIATSMDFGSGFLGTDDVRLLRRVAYLVGTDPEALTPDNMPHKPTPRYDGAPQFRFTGQDPRCAKCFKPWGYPTHQGWPEGRDDVQWDRHREEWVVPTPEPTPAPPAPPKPSKFTLTINIKPSAGR